MEIGKRRIKPGIEDAVRKGLLRESKFLPEWIAMDQSGRELFSEIAKLPEFYLSNSIGELSTLYNKAIAYNLKDESKRWNVIEWLDHPLQSSSLVREMLNAGIAVSYFPVTNSQHLAEYNNEKLFSLSSKIQLKDPSPDFTDAFEEIPEGGSPSLFLIGPWAESMESDDLAVMLKAIGVRSGRKDRIILHMDLIKSPAVIEKAYYDYQGTNAVYHKNALVRMNREMGANFDLKQFEYWPIYDAVTGSCKRYLVSQSEHVVKFQRPDFQVKFNPWETISIGSSQKYDNEMITGLLQMSGAVIEKRLTDRQDSYAIFILRSVRM